MAYYLLKATFGQKLEIKISGEEYARIMAACDGIWILIGIEENWDSLVQNYIEFEMEFLKAAMNSMVLTQNSFHEGHQLRLGFARRLSNLLSSCRSYLDQTPHQLKEIGGHSLEGSFKELTNKAYDGHFGYRVMEALRNYAQHRSLPLHGALFESSWVELSVGQNDDQALMRFTVSANIDKSRLESDPRFKKSIRQELEHKPTRIDVATVTREYIEALGALHLGLRELTNPLLKEWKEIVLGTIARYGSQTGGDVGGLCITEYDETDSVKPKIEVFSDPIVHLEKLIGRNGSLVNLRKRYVTNEIVPVRKSHLKGKAKQPRTPS